MASFELPIRLSGVIVRRAWYEGPELWSPALYRQLMVPVLHQDVKLVLEAGARFGYIYTSGTSATFDQLLDLEVDDLIGVDPVQGLGTDMAAFAKLAAGRMCLWGGVSAPMIVETCEDPR
jgi:hypothetical protein